MINLKYPVILASNSPRRKELLQKLEIPFTVETIHYEEHIPTHVLARDAAKFLAVKKGSVHKQLSNNAIIITADTIVLANGNVLGKPKSNKEAVNMLQNLSENTHEVITGVCIQINDVVHAFDVSTSVTFGKLTTHEIEHYVNSENAADKAGAYGIQDWIGLIGITRIEGSYYNVMGFPVYEVYSYLKHHFSRP